MNRNIFYLINEIIVFTPENNTLRALNSTLKPIILHTPSSQCLLLLIKHNNQILSQKFLFEEVWENNGAIVTANALYQNIALIRKAFKTLGLDQEVIKTVPKQGIKLSAHIIERSIDVTEGEVHIEAEKKMEDFIAQFQQQTSDAQTKPSGTNPTHDISGQAQDYKVLLRIVAFLRRNVFIRYVLPCLLSIGAFLLLYPVYQSQSNNGDRFVKSYYRLGEINNCLLYSSYEGMSVSREKFMTIQKAAGLHCKSGDVAYLTFNRHYAHDTLVYCNKNISDNAAKCKSIIFQETVNNEN